MRDPRVGINFSIGNPANDLGEVRWQRVSAGQQGHLPPMHQRMRERDILRGNSDVDQPARKSDQLQRLAHRDIIAGRIDDDLATLSIRQFL